MAPRYRDRLARGTRVMIGSLALVVALVMFLGWQAMDAAQDRRATAEQTVGDYAQFAATILGEAVGTWTDRTLLYGFYREALAWNESPPRVAELEELAGDPQEAERCLDTYGAGGRYFFRLDVSSGRWTTLGPLPATTGAWLADTLGIIAAPSTRSASGAVATPTRSSPYGHLFRTVDGRREVVAYRVRASDSGPIAVFAFNTCFATQGESIFRLALAGSTVLPPALVGDEPADSLLMLTATDPMGHELFTTGQGYGSDYVGRHHFRDGHALSGARLAVTLRPEVAERLVAGGLPPSRLPLIAGLIALALGLAAVTALQLRRSVSLVRARESFVRNVSHELRTPLQQILMFSQLLRLDPEEDERAHSAAVIEREALRLSTLVDRVLGFGRPKRNGGGDGPNDTVPLRFSQVVEEEVERLVPLAEAQEVRLECTAEDPVEVAVRPEEVRRIVANLLENALKYGPPGQTVWVRVSSEGGRARVSIDDEGPGIPEHERSRVWSPFYRLERDENGERTGSGIGLSVVRDLVSEAGGEVRIESSPAGGARLVVELPSVREG